MKLYQMPISHYCEKVRWMLDLKKIKHSTKNLLPGLHIAVIHKLMRKQSSGFPSTSVPVLKDQGKIIQGSDHILDHLDLLYPQPSFMPVDSELKQEVLKWEEFADQKLGPHVRRCCYYYLLRDPSAVIPMFTYKGPWYGRLLMKFMFPQLQAAMRKGMQIDQEGFNKSKAVLDEAVQTLASHLSTRQYLVDERLTRADIAVASLLAPLIRPQGYDVPWPQTLPEELTQLELEYQPVLQWVDKMYKNHRKP
ncbi:MAG TPA: glutathione S-transferase family protein [Gammaproteobacteria bacterium]|nr:glutathione S-transferase [Gammaproteobacteria bacterium]HCK92744.1 glutathione S-transferase family protein [Gammaproteobacteria bacterium]